MLRYAITLLVLATPALAESPANTPMSAEEFDAYATGRTLTFSTQNGPYGVERYLPGRRVIWSFLDGECEEGRWYPEGTSICFVYEFAPDDPQCWEMIQEGDRLRADFVNVPGTTILYEALDDQEALICGDFGV